MNLFNLFRKNVNPFNNVELEPKDLYTKLKDYYNNNGLYNTIQGNAYYNNTWVEAMKPIRTVVNRSVEFYVSKICPGDISQLRINTENETVKAAIEQVWKWSNFASQKQVAVRYLALFGDLFIKVVNDEDKVFFEIIEPKNVTDFKTDNRGYITEIRIDVPIVIEEKNLTHTEFWNKADNYYAIWLHGLGESTPLNQLGTPSNYGSLSELGIDFVPIVHIKFRDIGDSRGAGCVQHALDKIDEANREATRLTQLLFRYNKPIWAVSANSTDAQGRPLPPPKIKPSNANSSDSDIELKDNAIIYLPGTSRMDSLIPGINYGDALNILKDMMLELENDLPELRYYSLKDSQLSGKAIRLILASAIDRANEARGNFIQGLIRLNEMSLTIGSWMGIFRNIGTYDNSDFEHSITAPEMFETSLDERATTVQTLVNSGMALATAMRIAGFSEEEISQAVEEKQTEQESKSSLSTQNLANAMSNFNRE